MVVQQVGTATRAQPSLKEHTSLEVCGQGNAARPRATLPLQPDVMVGPTSLVQQHHLGRVGCSVMRAGAGAQGQVV